MGYHCTLIAVTDMARAKHFYCGLLGMTVTCDFGANVILSDAIALQTCESWQTFLDKSPEEIIFGHHASELYFEEDEMDSFLKKLASWPNISYIHPLKEHRWGQRVIRFYDPDHHIIEVGENIKMVVRRFLASGMTVAQTAKRMDVPESYILSCKEAIS